MSSVGILDASAVLAYLQRETGEQTVEQALNAGACSMCTVNLCEVLGKLCDKRMPLEEAEEAVSELGIAFVDFDADLAARAASLRTRTRTIGASLGDRACLALAERMSGQASTVTVYTAKQAWATLTWPSEIVTIR